MAAQPLMCARGYTLIQDVGSLRDEKPSYKPSAPVPGVKCP